MVLDPSDGVISCGENDVLVERDGVAWIIFFWMLHPEAVATILGPYWFTDCNDCNVFNWDPKLTFTCHCHSDRLEHPQN